MMKILKSFRNYYVLKEPKKKKAEEELEKRKRRTKNLKKNLKAEKITRTSRKNETIDIGIARKIIIQLN